MIDYDRVEGFDYQYMHLYIALLTVFIIEGHGFKTNLRILFKINMIVTTRL